MSLSNKLKNLLLSALGNIEARNELVTAIESGGGAGSGDLKSDGSVAMAANFNLANHSLINVNSVIPNSNNSNILGDYGSEFKEIHASHIVSQGDGASASVLAGAGSGAGVSSLSSLADSSGGFNLATGTGASGGDTVTITFSVSFNAVPNVVLFPGNSNAADPALKVFVIPTTDDFTLNLAAAGIDDGTEYIWYYHVIES